MGFYSKAIWSSVQFYGFGGKSELQPVSEPRSTSGILQTKLSIVDSQKNENCTNSKMQHKKISAKHSVGASLTKTETLDFKTRKQSRR